MHDFLFFQLAGPMASWGETAVGEIRPSQFSPSKSAVLGLLAAAMGVQRTNEDTLLRIMNGYRQGSFVQRAGSLLRDYHTVQAPSFNKKVSYKTRREEILVKKHKLNTLLTSREYITDGFYFISISIGDKKMAPFSLEQLKQGLMYPKFSLYLGRKSCPVALPLFPQIRAGDSFEEAFSESIKDFRHKLDEINLRIHFPNQFSIYWEDGIPTKLSNTKITKIRDHYTSRKRWQFQERKLYSTTWTLKQEE